MWTELKCFQIGLSGKIFFYKPMGKQPVLKADKKLIVSA
jgi:hypothetical protein